MIIIHRYQKRNKRSVVNEFEIVFSILLPDILSAPNILKISSSRDKKNLVPPENKMDK